MARRRRNSASSEEKTYNRGGYSQAALKALDRGEYGKLTGRKSQYNTSQEQTQQAKSLPVLKGINIPTTDNSEWQSSFSRNRDNAAPLIPAQGNGVSAPLVGVKGNDKSAKLTDPREKTRKSYVDTDKARRKYAERLTKPSSRYSNETVKKNLETPKKSNRDTKYDKDFDEFYEWRYNKLGVMPDYDPNTGNNVEHWEQVKKDIMAKNNWSEKEFDSKWEAYDKERTQKMADEEVQAAVNIAKESPALGTVVQALYTPQTWIEGAASMIGGLGSAIGRVTGKNPLEKYMPTSSDDTQFTGTRLKEAVKQEVKDNHIDSSLGKTLYEGGTGLFDMVESMGMPGGVIWQGASKAGSKHMQNLERGVDKNKAAESAALSGVASAALNKIGLEKVLGGTGKTLAGTILKGANTEGMENVAEDVIDLAIDKAINGDKSELDALHNYYVSQGGDEGSWGKVVGDKLGDLGISYGSGALMGGLIGTANHIPELGDYISTKKNNRLNAIDPKLRAYLADAMKVPEDSIDAPRISAKSDAELGEQSKNISKQLQKMADGEMASNEYVTLGETPRYMQEYGDVNNPLVMPQNVVTKHGLDEAVVENLPQQFNNPVAVMRSRTQPNSGVVMTDIVDKHGNPVIVPIHMDKETDMGIVNEVPSAYGKKGAKNFINNSEVAFENKERVNEALSGNGVQFSELNGSNNPIFNSKIEQKGGNVNGSDIPPVSGNANPDNPNMGQSRVITNTAINSDVISSYDYDNDPIIKEIATYAKHSNEATYNNALNNVKKNGSKLLSEYNNDQRIIDNDQDVDQAMILLRSLKEQIKDSSPENAALLTAQKNMLLSKLREAGTKYGQTIQAFAKWNDTSEGALMNGTGMLDETTKKWKSRNQQQVKKNQKVAEDIINNLGKKPENRKLNNALNSLVEENAPRERVAPTTEEIRQQVRNTLDSEAASLGEFSDEDVNYLTNLIQNGATKQELAQALDTKLATGRFAISQETQARVNELFDKAETLDPNSREACEAKAEAYKLIANEVVGDASPFEKFEAWRYIAMLGNPKTMLRNLVGNGMFSAVTGTSNTLSAALEAGVDKTMKAFGGKGIQRTKAVLNPAKDGGLIKGAWADAESHRYKQLAGSKYEKSNMKDTLKGEKSVFNSKAMQKVESAVDKGISDYAAIRAKYSTSLAGWMKANGLDESAFDAEPRYKNLQAESRVRVLTDAEKAEMNSLKQTMDALEKGRDYALKQAEYATFHEDNAVADFLSKQSRDLISSDNKIKRGMGYALEGVVPFKKTPANILRSGFEYSPLGAIDSIKKTGKLIYENTGKRKNNLGDTYTKKSWWRGDEKEVERSLASDVIDSWAKTLTGTALAGLGYYLKNKGILNSSEGDEKYQDDLEGIQNYSITINGKTYTVDWAAPGVMPLLLGAEIKKIYDRNGAEDKHFYDNIDEIIGSVNSILDPIFETSMMQGVQNVLESAANEVKYNENNSAVGGIAGALATNAVTGYGTQAIPTVLGQIARTVDPTRRATDTATNSNFLGGVEKQGRKLMNKIPGLSYLNPAYRDAYGRTQGNSPTDNPFVNFAYQALSPAYIRDINTTNADTLSRDVYNATTTNAEGKEVPIHDKDVFAPWKSKVTYGGEKLSPEQMEIYREKSGEASYAIRDALSKEGWFNQLDGDRQTEILKGLKSLVNKIGLEANGYPQTGKDYEVYQKGGIPALIDRYKGSAENNAIKEQTGLNATSNAAKAIKADMESGNTQAAEQKIDEAQQLSNLGFTKPNPTETYYKAKSVAPSLTTEEFAKTYKEIDADGNQGIKQDELISYFNKNHFTSESEAMKVWQMYAPKGKKVPYLKADGTWGKH